MTGRGERRHGLLRRIVNDFPWIHLSLGLLGNTCFVVGSVFFLWESLKHVGTVLFVIGSSGMLIGSIGHAVRQLEEKHRD